MAARSPYRRAMWCRARKSRAAYRRYLEVRCVTISTQGAVERAHREDSTMKQEDDPVFTRPEEYGIENLEAPGEPDRAHQPPSSPVPGTGREARETHQLQHDARGATPRDDI